MLTISLVLAAVAGEPSPAVNVSGNLNYSKRVQKRWKADIPSYIIKGQANWPDVLKK